MEAREGVTLPDIQKDDVYFYYLADKNMKTVTISPLHIDISFTYTTPDCPYIFPYGGPVELVMKDGTTAKALEAYFDARTQTVVDPDDVAGTRLVCFDVSVIVDDIDYIILGSEHIFDVN